MESETVSQRLKPESFLFSRVVRGLNKATLRGFICIWINLFSVEKIPYVQQDSIMKVTNTNTFLGTKTCYCCLFTILTVNPSYWGFAMLSKLELVVASQSLNISWYTNWWKEFTWGLAGAPYLPNRSKAFSVLPSLIRLAAYKATYLLRTS